MKNLREPYLQNNALLKPLIGLQKAVQRQSVRLNLISSQRVDSLWITLAEESTYGLPYLPANGKVLDVGSGNGIPGLVWAVLRPDLFFVLAESVNKKAVALEAIRWECGLKNVTVFPGEVQTLRNQTFDVISARAVAPFDSLWQWTTLHRKTGTRYLLFRGSRDLNENSEYSDQLKEVALIQAGRIKLWVGDVVGLENNLDF